MKRNIINDLRRVGHLGPDCLRYVRSRKRLVLVHSAMRAGSTLLNALLAMAPDISHLPEVPFRTFSARNKWQFFNHFTEISPEPIVVLKHPIWYARTRLAWRPPSLGRLHNILLVRDCLPSCLSLRQMPRKMPESAILEYWYTTNRALVEIMQRSSDNWLVVRYEELTADPKATTAGIFRAIRSEQTEGVDQYSPSSNFDWEWSQGDGGERIGSLVVHAPTSTVYDPVFSPLIDQSRSVQQVRALLNYSD